MVQGATLQSTEKIKDFINNQNCACIASVDEHGFPNLKVMLKPRKIIGVKEFFFSTNTSEARVSHYKISIEIISRIPLEYGFSYL